MLDSLSLVPFEELWNSWKVTDRPTLTWKSLHFSYLQSLMPKSSSFLFSFSRPLPNTGAEFNLSIYPMYISIAVGGAEFKLSIYPMYCYRRWRCMVQTLYLSHVFLLQVEVHGSNSESPPPDSHSSHLSLEPESPPYSRSVSRRKSTLLQVSEPILLQLRKCTNSSSESTRYSKSESTPYTPSQRYTIYCNPESTHCPLSENPPCSRSESILILVKKYNLWRSESTLD